MEADITLMELLEGLPDPPARGKRHPLSALLSLAVVAMLAGMTTYEAIVDYGKERGWEFLQLLGFTRRRGLCKATSSRSSAASMSPPSRLPSPAGSAAGSSRATPHLAIDGKTLRGSRDGETPAVHLLSAYAPDVEAVVAQMRVDAKTNELKAAPEMLAILPIKGRLITADAIQTHRGSAPQRSRGAGTTSCRSRTTNRRCGPISRPLSPRRRPAFPPPEPAPCRLPGAGHDRGQGAWSDQEGDAGVDDLAGRLFGRRLAGLPASVPPARERHTGEKVEVEVVFGITSLSRERAGQAKLLDAVRAAGGSRTGCTGGRDGT